MKSYFPFAFIGLTLIALKLFNQVEWNWSVVLSAFWLPIALGIIWIAVVYVFSLINNIAEDIFDFGYKIWRYICYGEERH